MIELFPATIYYPVFLVISIILTLVYSKKLKKGITYPGQKGSFGIILPYAILFIVIIGLRPISIEFADTVSYAEIYQSLAGQDILSASLTFSDDLVFSFFMWACAQVMPCQVFFLIIEILYMVPVIIAIKKLVPGEPGAMLLFFMTAFSFFSYGTNGIRNGMACSLVILILALLQNLNVKKFIAAALLAVVAFFTHRSVALPIVCAVVCLIYGNTKGILAFWFLSIFISLVAGSQVETFFIGLGFDERMAEYSSENVNEEAFSHVGFRWDFLLYSAMPILLGWYIVIKRKIKDKTYQYFLNVYILCNAFWIMVIRMASSNRFAYLSWFLYPIVLGYPLLSFPVFKKANNKKVALILFAHTMFTVIMGLR